VEEKQEALVQKGKGKGIKIPLERKDETFVKDFEEPVIRKEETPVQEEEESEKKPIETVHATVPPNSQTYKILIKKLRDARKEIAHLKA
jgi:hypothetical protein